MQLCGALTLEEEWEYEPKRDPLLQILLWEVQVLPKATEDDSYAVALDPWGTLWPLKLHLLGAVTLHDE